MRLAIVCDDLIQKGGQEKLVMELFKIWPNAVLYTSVASSEWQNICAKQKINLKTSFLQKIPFAEKFNKFYSLFLFHILAFERFDFSHYDIVLSVSSRYAHFIITKPTTRHICYMNSPGRMFWEPFDYFKSEKIPDILRPFINMFISYVRDLDFAAAQRVDSFIANASTPLKRIDKYYRRKADIIYPPVDITRFNYKNAYIGDYFLILTRLSSWKSVDIAVEACNRLGLNLKIIGDGPDKKRLKNMSGGTVEVLGYVTDETRDKLLYGCKAFIMTQKEDFGIAAVEAMAAGKPVLAYGNGGALETVIPGVTGEFFLEQSSESLMGLLKSFDPQIYDPSKCHLQAEKFDALIFRSKMKRLVV